MKIVCAWCGKDMGEKEPTFGNFKYEVTHGMCEECLAEEMKELDEHNRLHN